LIFYTAGAPLVSDPKTFGIASRSISSRAITINQDICFCLC